MAEDLAHDIEWVAAVVHVFPDAEQDLILDIAEVRLDRVGVHLWRQ